MAGFLIGEEGPLSGLTLRFETGEEWVLGRDPDEVGVVLEDPMVSRKHVILQLTPEGFILDNLSSVNPATQNGKVIVEPVLLREGDIIQIGSTFFRFSEREPKIKEEKRVEESLSPVLEEPSELAEIHYDNSSLSRWLLKVVSGPNAGAEFGVKRNTTYLLGKDPNLCDIVFQDLSVSRQHAKIVADSQENVFIEDLGSRNGVLINGELISERQALNSEDIIALGTTTFLMIDREQVRETIVSVPEPPKKEVVLEPLAEEKEAELAPSRDWRDMLISKKVLAWAGVAAAFLFTLIVFTLALFKSEPIEVADKQETEKVAGALKNYEDVQFSFNPTTGNLLLVGHLLTAIEKKELLYGLESLPFIQKIDDNIIVDELVWENMNALLSNNPAWGGVSFVSLSPGNFVMRGYVMNAEDMAELTDYVNMHFPYVDRLTNRVVVHNNLLLEIESLLIAQGFSSVTFQLNDGELLLVGRVDSTKENLFQKMVDQFKMLEGVRQVKNLVIFTTADSSRIDLSEKYHVTGYSTKDEESYFVVINGRIVSPGDSLDGMTITKVLPEAVLLEKDGLKFKIHYNQQ